MALGHQLLDLRSDAERIVEDVLGRSSERTRHPFRADALAREAEHEVLRGARDGRVVLQAQLRVDLVLRLQRNDHHLGHTLGHGPLLLVQATELRLGLRAARVEAPRLGQEVVGRHDSGVERAVNRLGRDLS